LAPDPAGGAYSAPPDPLAAFKGPTYLRGRKRKSVEGKEGGEGKGREEEGKGRGMEGRGGQPPIF